MLVSSQLGWFWCIFLNVLETVICWQEQSTKGDLLTENFPSASQTTIIPGRVTSKHMNNDNYLAATFSKNEDVNNQDVSKMLNDIWINIINRISIGQMSIHW